MEKSLSKLKNSFEQQQHQQEEAEEQLVVSSTKLKLHLLKELKYRLHVIIDDHDSMSTFCTRTLKTHQIKHHYSQFISQIHRFEQGAVVGMEVSCIEQLQSEAFEKTLPSFFSSLKPLLSGKQNEALMRRFTTFQFGIEMQAVKERHVEEPVLLNRNKKKLLLHRKSFGSETGKSFIFEEGKMVSPRLISLLESKRTLSDMSSQPPSLPLMPSLNKKTL